MRTLMLKEDVGRDRIEQMLRGMGLVLHPSQAPEGVFRQLWMTPDEQSAIHYVDDSNTKVRYFSVRGKKEKALQKQLKEALPIWKRDDLLKHALFTLKDGTDEDRQRVAMEVSAEMDEYDAASAGVLTAFLKMDEPATRLAGARALRARPWPIFRVTAEQLANDADPAVAAVGKEWLARIDQLQAQQ